MRRSLAWLACAAGALFFLRRRRRRPRLAPAAPDPAEELRRKLDETRDETVEAESAPARPAGADERRREVHERGRAAIDSMRGEPPSKA